MTFNTEIIEKYLKENGISKSTFCKKCRISFATLKKLYENDLGIGLNRVLKIVRLLDIKFSDLLKK